MFTGIVKSVGTLRKLQTVGTNLVATVESDLAEQLHVDQSVAHDGVCLTVTAVSAVAKTHTVTIIQESLTRTALSEWEAGRAVNLELAMVAGARLDGHLVQGHVDITGTCLSVIDNNGSWDYRFRFEPTPERVLVDKGSICINGVSLTVVSPTRDEFGVSIIPYTYEHTNFKRLAPGDRVNLEFDIIGKYVVSQAALYGGMQPVLKT